MLVSPGSQCLPGKCLPPVLRRGEEVATRNEPYRLCVLDQGHGQRTHAAQPEVLQMRDVRVLIITRGGHATGEEVDTAFPEVVKRLAAKRIGAVIHHGGVLRLICKESDLDDLKPHARDGQQIQGVREGRQRVHPSGQPSANKDPATARSPVGRAVPAHTRMAETEPSADPSQHVSDRTRSPQLSCPRQVASPCWISWSRKIFSGHFALDAGLVGVSMLINRDKCQEKHGKEDANNCHLVACRSPFSENQQERKPVKRFRIAFGG
jgi:hypothetical protein